MKVSSFKLSKQIDDWNSGKNLCKYHRKTKYRSRRKAFKQKIKYSHVVKLYVYECPRCCEWHLTRSSPEEYIKATKEKKSARSKKTLKEMMKRNKDNQK
jgi:hypothetical protein